MVKVRDDWNYLKTEEERPILKQANWFEDEIAKVMDKFCIVFGGKDGAKCVGCMYKKDSCPMSAISTLPSEVNTRILLGETIKGGF